MRHARFAEMALSGLGLCLFGCASNQTRYVY